MKVLLTLLFILAGLPLYALNKETPLLPGVIDSLLPVLNNSNHPDSIVSDIESVETDYRKTGNDRKAMVHLLKIIKYRRATRNIRAKERLFGDLAGLSARLKLYPLAMRCYYKSVQLKSRGPLPLFTIEDSLSGREAMRADFSLTDSTAFERLTNMDTSQINNGAPYEVRSKPINGLEIWEPFNDGKAACSYALLLQVKQPVPGRRRAFTHINNVGHTFITLIKYNVDNSIVSRSFGFYPQKKTLLSGTPFHPGSASFFRDDTLHDWDEIVGKFITFKEFKKIIKVVKHYDGRMYDLNENNCTDFALNVALIGGIKIKDTRGGWPFGKGNNPANAGQSILEGKVENMDAGFQEPMFVAKNNVLTDNH